MRHYWNHGPHGGWSWIVPGITMLLLWLVLIAVLVLLWRMLARGRTSTEAAPRWGRPPGPPVPPAPDRPPSSGAEQVLAERLARGEIDVDEYRHRLDALRGNRPQPPPPPPTPPAG